MIEAAQLNSAALVDILLGAIIGLGASLITLYAGGWVSERARKSIEIYEPIYNGVKSVTENVLPVDDSGEYRSAWDSIEA